jgi:hypothetical protein
MKRNRVLNRRERVTRRLKECRSFAHYVRHTWANVKRTITAVIVNLLHRRLPVRACSNLRSLSQTRDASNRSTRIQYPVCTNYRANPRDGSQCSHHWMVRVTHDPAHREVQRSTEMSQVSVQNRLIKATQYSQSWRKNVPEVTLRIEDEQRMAFQKQLLPDCGRISAESRLKRGEYVHIERCEI